VKLTISGVSCPIQRDDALDEGAVLENAQTRRLFEQRIFGLENLPLHSVGAHPTRAPKMVKHTKPTTLRATAIQQALAAETLRPEVTVIRTYNSDKEVVATYVKVRGTLGVLT